MFQAEDITRRCFGKIQAAKTEAALIMKIRLEMQTLESRKSRMIILLLAISINAFASTVLDCNDGDTCRVSESGSTFKVRLAGIDAPEKGQDGYEAAKEFLSRKILGKNVVLKCNGKSYGRRTCEIFLEGENIQETMVREGLALDFPKYSHGKYFKAQQLAKSEKLGIWKIPSFVSPHCFRWTGTPECNRNPQFQP